MAYDPNQPRDPAGTKTGGQWTETGAERTAKAAREAANVMSMVDIRDKVQVLEKQLYDRDTERLLVIDASTGKMLAWKDGDKVSVQVDDYKDKDILQSAKGNIVSHNHPNVDYPFSPDDLYSALRFDAAEMRVVGKTMTHSLRPGPNGWGNLEDIGDLGSLVEYHMAEIAGQYGWDSSTYTGVGKPIAHWFVWEASEQDRTDIFMDTMDAMAKDLGWTYETWVRKNWKGWD